MMLLKPEEMKLFREYCEVMAQSLNGQADHLEKLMDSSTDETEQYTFEHAIADFADKAAAFETIAEFMTPGESTDNG